MYLILPGQETQTGTSAAQGNCRVFSTVLSQAINPREGLECHPPLLSSGHSPTKCSSQLVGLDVSISAGRYPSVLVPKILMVKAKIIGIPEPRTPVSNRYFVNYGF